MKTWIKRSLVGILGAGIVLGGLSACSERHERHGMAMDGAYASKMQEKVVERVSKELALTDAQKQQLVRVGERIREQQLALVGSTKDPRADVQALVSGPKFDRARALAIVEEKTQAIRGKSPELIAAAADFYDSLDPAQQQKLRERLQKRHRWFGHD
jgi:periplasmic protein CpxP/Spy